MQPSQQLTSIRKGGGHGRGLSVFVQEFAQQRKKKEKNGGDTSVRAAVAPPLRRKKGGKGKK